MTKNATLETAKLDEFDKRIIACVQADNQLSHAKIGDRVGLSASAVRRRLADMHDKNVIHKDMALVHPDFHGVTLIVTIVFGDETPDIYEAFNAQMGEAPEVQQSYHIAGDEDYILIVHGPNLKWYEEWSKATFMTNPAIRRYSTRVVWSCKKYDPAIVF